MNKFLLIALTMISFVSAPSQLKATEYKQVPTQVVQDAEDLAFDKYSRMKASGFFAALGAGCAGLVALTALPFIYSNSGATCAADNAIAQFQAMKVFIGAAAAATLLGLLAKKLLAASDKSYALYNKLLYSKSIHINDNQ